MNNTFDPDYLKTPEQREKILNELITELRGELSSASLRIKELESQLKERTEELVFQKDPQIRDSENALEQANSFGRMMRDRVRELEKVLKKIASRSTTDANCWSAVIEDVKLMAQQALEGKSESIGSVKEGTCPGEYVSYNAGWIIECKLCGQRPIDHKRKE